MYILGVYISGKAVVFIAVLVLVLFYGLSDSG